VNLRKDHYRLSTDKNHCELCGFECEVTRVLNDDLDLGLTRIAKTVCFLTHLILPVLLVLLAGELMLNLYNF